MKNSPKASLTHKLCQLYGFTATQRLRRIAQLQLSVQDAQLIQQIQRQVIQPHCAAIMDAFYDFILAHDELRQFLKNEQQIHGLKQTQTEYLLSLGVQFESADYFEYRLRVGVAHARINMPLSSYLVAYGRLQEIIFGYMYELDLNGPYCMSICKVLILDMSLAIDAYNNSQIQSMSKSIDELEHEKTRLHNQLIHDTLTGAYSRAYILEQLHKRLSELKRDPQKQFALALMDLDKFKHVNDTYGHQAGDVVLYEFSRTIADIIRRQDDFGRYGGEEFLLIMVDLDGGSAFELAERIRNLLAQKIYTFEQHSFNVTTSIGLAIPAPGDSAKSIIERADKALYQAKSAGRNKTILLRSQD